MTDTRTPYTEALARAMEDLGVEVEPQNIEEYLALLKAAVELEDAARTVLNDAVASSRSAGAAWSAIGSTLGMSRQAAQKRFATPSVPSAEALDADERILGPVTAFDEMRELALAGRYGWHSVGFGALHHRVVRSTTQWEHRRVTMLPGRIRALQDDGWELIGSGFPFAYLKKDLRTPAIEEER